MSQVKNFRIVMDSDEIAEFVSENQEIRFTPEDSTLMGFPFYSLEAPREILVAFLLEQEYDSSEISEMIQD